MTLGNMRAVNDGGQRPGSSPGTRSRAGIEFIDENEAISRMATGAEQELVAQLLFGCDQRGAGVPRNRPPRRAINNNSLHPLWLSGAISRELRLVSVAQIDQ